MQQIHKQVKPQNSGYRVSKDSKFPNFPGKNASYIYQEQCMQFFVYSMLPSIRTLQFNIAITFLC